MLDVKEALNKSCKESAMFKAQFLRKIGGMESGTHPSASSNPKIASSIQ